MKFDFVIGNPPYQDNKIGDNENYAPPVYQFFMNAAFAIANRVELITPARFLFNAGSTPKQWNKKMINDPHFKVLRLEQKSDLVFPGTDIKGGVVISYRDINKTFSPINVFVYHSELLTLIKKVKKTNFRPISELVFAPSSLRFTEKMYSENPVIDRQSLISNELRYALKSNIFNKLENIVFFQEKPTDHDEYIQIYGRKDNERKYMWIKKKYIQGSKNFDKYKVMLPAYNGSGAIGEVLSTPLIGTPLIGHTETFLTIGCFETEEEASNCLKYIKTKFARAMLGVLKITQSNTKQTWEYVPQQNFSDSSDIDWKKSINEVDAQLYRKYNLTEDEKTFIESKVRPMDS